MAPDDVMDCAPPALRLALLGVLLAVAAAAAHADPALAKERNCMNCHQIERKVVGPAFVDVARRYAGKPGAATLLADKIVKGGAGNWGPVAMSANPKVTPAEAQKLAAWVLAQK